MPWHVLLATKTLHYFLGGAARGVTPDCLDSMLRLNRRLFSRCAFLLMPFLGPAAGFGAALASVFRFAPRASSSAAASALRGGAGAESAETQSQPSPSGPRGKCQTRPAPRASVVEAGTRGAGSERAKDGGGRSSAAGWEKMMFRTWWAAQRRKAELRSTEAAVPWAWSLIWSLVTTRTEGADPPPSSSSVASIQYLASQGGE